jgi:hypothetical protein
MITRETPKRLPVYDLGMSCKNYMCITHSGMR